MGGLVSVIEPMFTLGAPGFPVAHDTPSAGQQLHDRPSPDGGP
ncbi:MULTISPECIES: hypothetical protein [unclassified Micromonospora]